MTGAPVPEPAPGPAPEQAPAPTPGPAAGPKPVPGPEPVPGPATGPGPGRGSDAAPGRATIAALFGSAPVVAFAPVFGREPAEALTNPDYLLPVGGAALVPVVVCLVVAAATRLPPVTRLTLGLAGLAGYLALALPAQVGDGPYRLLTSVPPVEPAGPERAVVALAAGLATLGAVEPALRRRGLGWCLAAPLLATVAGLALGAPTGVVPWLAPAVALLGGVLLAVDARDRRRAAGAGNDVAGGDRGVPDASGHDVSGGGGRGGPRLLAGAGLVAMLAASVAAGLLGPALLAAAGDPPPYDARDLVSQQVQPREDTSPLSQFPALRSGKLALRLSVVSDRPPERLRYATLDQFTGTYWTTDASYWRVGRDLPAPEPAVVGEVARERVRVTEAGPLGWIVAAGRPLEVSEGGLGVDRASGDVALPADRPVPREYEVRSVVPRPDLAALVTDPPVRRGAETGDDAGDGTGGDSATGAGAGSSGSGSGNRTLPPALAATAAQLVGDRSGYPAVRRLADHFTRDGGFTVDASPRPPTGHGLLQINRLLVTRQGTAEQYASAFAVLVRALGYDARVVVGFRPGAPGPGGRYAVTGRDVDAWAEVRFTDAGWVPFLVTPGERADDTPPEAERQPAEPADAARPDAPPATQRPDAPNRAGAPGGDSPAGPGYLTLAVAALVVLLVVGPPGAKLAVRARRRRAADPRRRVFGAWRDTLDRYAEAGLPAPAASTTRELAARVAERFPTPAGPTLDLALLVDAAAYGPHGVGEADAGQAWLLADRIRRQLAGSLSRPRWLVAALAPPRRRTAAGQVPRDRRLRSRDRRSG